MISWDIEDTVLKDLNLEPTSNNKYICGIDEVGRGSLAGPVVACAAVFKSRNISFLNEINDSKKLSKAKRNVLWDKLQEHIVYALGWCDNTEIDLINIYNASLLAMKRAYINLCTICSPGFVIIDGNKTIDLNVSSMAVVKGDSKSFTIAAASILAKVYRDKLMSKLSQDYSCGFYGWEHNSGYGTKKHKKALNTFGITKYHRKTFAPVKELI